MERVADYIAKFLVKHGVEDIFMLTGYGSMYLNDAIELSGIRYFATRNEATAPMMAEAYARIKQSIGAVCVTAGPGATNAVPGLAEAWVDSAPIIILSGQVEKKHTTHWTGLKGLRTFGTAEINIIPIVTPLTKFAAVVENPEDIRFLLEKSFYLALEGRPGPVWLDIPIDVQQAMIDPDHLIGFDDPQNVYNISEKNIYRTIELLLNSQNPLIMAGQGVRQGNAIEDLKIFLKRINVPVLFSRLGQDILPHNHPNVFGQAGMKGSKYCKKIMQQADVVLSLGCRLAVQLVGHKFEAFQNAKVVAVDICEDELKKPATTIYLPLHGDVKNFLSYVNDILIKDDIKIDRLDWMQYCQRMRNDYPMLLPEQCQNPIDLYYFMSRLDVLSNERHILVSDAGSNYYVGGQVWKFERGQREVTSGTYAAMGTGIPLAIGSAVAKPKSQVLAVTGDGSLELNVQELKTISHYNFNIKLFVINNGGYASMRKWQDTFFDGRRIDTADKTGAGTLNLHNVAHAFDMEYDIIQDYKEIDDKLKDIMKHDNPVFVEVVTDNFQKIVEGFIDN